MLTPAYASDTELFLPEGKIEKSFETLAKKLQNFAEKNLQDTTLTNFKFEAVKVDRASGKTGVSLSTADRGTHILVTINYDQRAVQNPFEFAKAILPFFGALNSTHFGQPETHISTRGIEVIEMLENAKLGSLSAQAALAKIRSSMIKNLDPQSPGFRALVGNLSAKKLNLADKFIRSETNLAEEETKELEQQAKEISQKRQKYYEEWKKSSGSLEKAESMKQKLDDLIRKNDRTGVRKLIELYLPWPIMEPVEARSWRLWLEAIEKPDPEKSTLVFRGLDSKNDVL
ncbi:MAG: hypothetical protein N2578_10070, partial [Bdellovibrionaceae bacterium]|nr:hypothetical protein [Pseudobdellovibrionaceae bacterium]